MEARDIVTLAGLPSLTHRTTKDSRPRLTLSSALLGEQDVQRCAPSVVDRRCAVGLLRRLLALGVGVLALIGLMYVLSDLHASIYDVSPVAADAEREQSPQEPDGAPTVDD